MTSQPNKPFDPASKTPKDPAAASPRDKDVLASPFTIADDKPAQAIAQKASDDSFAGPSEGYCERVKVGSEVAEKVQEKAPSRKIAYDSDKEAADTKPKAAAPETPAPKKEEPKAAPTPAAKAAVVPASPPVQTTSPVVPPAPVAAAAPVDTSQLVLRALFGVSHNLDSKEIIERAGKLEGIKNVKEVSQAEIAAMQLLCDGMSKMGFGSQIDLNFSTPEGDVDLLAEQGKTLAVLRNGEYAPGVRETLILIARELSNLS